MIGYPHVARRRASQFQHKSRRDLSGFANLVCALALAAILLSMGSSMSSAISYPATRSASLEAKRSRHAKLLPQPEPELGLPILARANLVRVTTGHRGLPGKKTASPPRR